MTSFRWTHSPSDPLGKEHPLPSAIPHISGVALDMQCRGGHDCAAGSSDLFDAASPSEGLIILLLINVAPHSQRPLRLLALAQDVFRSGAAQFAGASGEQSLGALLQQRMRAIRQSLDAAAPVYFATATLAAYETSTATLTWVSAGAPPLLLKEGRKVEAVAVEGAALSLPTTQALSSAPLALPVHSISLPPGSAAVFVTTGLVQARSRAASPGGSFGLPRAVNALAASSTSDAQELCRALITAAIRFEQQPSHFGPPLKIPGFREIVEEDMTAVALVRPA